MYGLKTEAEAQSKIAALKLRFPEDRFEVALHKYPQRNWFGHDDLSVSYGVKRYTPYCDAMPERFAGFVWF
jgi:hypothetical protein